MVFPLTTSGRAWQKRGSMGLSQCILYITMTHLASCQKQLPLTRVVLAIHGLGITCTQPHGQPLLPPRPPPTQGFFVALPHVISLGRVPKMAPLRPSCPLQFHKACSDHGTLTHPSFTVQRATPICSLFSAFSNTTGKALLLSSCLIPFTVYIPLLSLLFSRHAVLLPTN